MEQPTIPDTVTVLATVKSRGETPGGLFKVELDIPDFGSQYPTNLNQVSPYDADLMVVGSTVRVVLERQRERGDGKNKDRLYGWWWGLVSTEHATEEEIVVAKAATTDIEQAATSKNRSIDRAVALKAATEFAGYLITVQQREISHADILGYAAAFDHWLHTGERVDNTEA